MPQSNTRERLSLLLLGLVCVLALSLATGAAWGDSAVTDEIAHSAAGYSYVRYLDGRLNPEHPPLVKALAGLALLPLKPNFSTDETYWQKDVNGQWAAGTHFLYQAGNSAEQVIFMGRLGAILIFAAVILATYWWSRRLVGPMWALVPTSLTALSPHFIAHGHYITTDVAATLGILVATYAFVTMHEQPSWQRFIAAGLLFGIAQLTKFSALFLLPYLLLLTILLPLMRAPRTSRQQLSALLRSIGLYAGVVVLGYSLIVYPAYVLLTSRYPAERQQRDTRALLQEAQTDISRNLAVPWLPHMIASLTNSAYTRPLAHYAVGAYLVTHRYEEGNATYFLGTVRPHGSPWYFPVLYLAKEPLPILILLTLASAGAITRAISHRSFGKKMVTSARRWAATHPHELSLFLLSGLFIGLSLRSPLNLGIRHILPALPPLYILATSVLRSSTRPGPIRHAVTIALLIWLTTETLVVNPHFLSYYNQLAGGTAHGYRIAADSNYDWGQDMRRFEQWLEQHSEITTIALDYSGDSSVHYFVPDRVVDWSPALGNPASQGIGWFAVSVNKLQRIVQPQLAPATSDHDGTYDWLVKMKPKPEGLGTLPSPDERVGTSIVIYQLPHSAP